MLFCKFKGSKGVCGGEPKSLQQSANFLCSSRGGGYKGAKAVLSWESRPLVVNTYEKIHSFPWPARSVGVDSLVASISKDSSFRKMLVLSFLENFTQGWGTVPCIGPTVVYVIQNCLSLNDT